MTEGTDRERLFAELVVEQGLATREQVDECLKVLDALRAEGVDPRPALGELLYRKGFLSSGAYARTLRAGPASSPEVATPGEVAAALSDPSRVAGKFVKVALLGRGGMGEVWKAWDRELGRYVALKFLLGGEQEPLLREARVAAGLVHPNIAPVYETGTSEGRAYIAMQFVEGTTLARARLPLPQTLLAVREAALALDFAHRAGVVHRDVKPENLMVAAGRVYVMDFGLARQTRLDVSRSGTAVGTPEYMSPEQASGRSNRVDARTDVYALGATLYALLSGRPPHRDEDLLGLLRKVEHEEPVPPRRINPEVPPEVETIVLQAMEKDPARRYATAAELADDLGRFLDGEPVRARRASLLYRLRKRLKKRRGLVAAALAGVLAVGAVVVPGWWSERRGRREDVAALQELGMLWAGVVVEKQGLHNAGNDPSEVLGRVKAAVERLDDFVRRHPDRPQGWYVRARGRLYLGNLPGAEEDLRRALRDRPEFAPGWALLGRVKLEQHTVRVYRPSADDDRWREAAPLMEEARECLARGSKAEAGRASIASWGLARTIEDEVAETLIAALAETYLGDAPEGRRLLEEANRRQEHAEYCNWLGALAAGSKRYAEAIEWQTRAISKMAHFAKAYLDRANARLEVEADPRAAIDDFGKALVIDPSLAPAWLGRAIAREEIKDHEGAEQDYTRVLELNPGDVPAYVFRGSTRLKRGNAAGALEDLDRAIRTDPGSKRAWAARGHVRGCLRDRAGAEEDYRRALEIDPEYREGYVNRAGTRFLLGELGPALADATRAVELAPDREGARTTRALIRRELSKTDRAKAKEHLGAALADLEKDLELAPAHWPKRALAEELTAEVRAALERAK